MKNIYKIKGMHCRSCEVLIENEVKGIPDVKKVIASTRKGILTVISDSDVSADVANAVKVAGYDIVKEDVSWINKNKKSYLELLVGISIAFIVVFLFQLFDFTRLLNPASFTSSNLAAIFTIGLTAGVSSCMALVGGLVLGISARYSEKHSNSSPIQKFRPHIFFNLGRIISFFVLGGLMGSIGSILRISGPALGIMIILVAIVMFVLGLQLTEIFPKLTSITLPKFFSMFQGKKDKEYSHLNSMFLGALTFFMPCGFTQAVQIYSISTGSFLQGALVMSFFALGTTPGLLGIGGLTSFIKKGVYSKIFFKTVGVLIIILSLYNFQNGLNLANIKITDYKKNTETNQSSSENNFSNQNKEVQIIKAVYNPQSDGSQYVIEPREFTVKVNTPVRFEIYAEKDGEGCMGSITLPGLSYNFQAFTKGETAVFEFTPKNVKEYKITCGMGIPMGAIKVIN